jgi:hypothetical protein
LADQIDPRKVKQGFWLSDSVYVKAENAERKKERLLLKNFIILTVYEQKTVGALFLGSFQVPLVSKEAKL